MFLPSFIVPFLMSLQFFALLRDAALAFCAAPAMLCSYAFVKSIRNKNTADFTGDQKVMSAILAMIKGDIDGQSVPPS